jgi:hypothetical protein
LTVDSQLSRVRIYRSAFTPLTLFTRGQVNPKDPKTKLSVPTAFS